MWTLITDGFQFLYHQSTGSLIAIFWLTILFDIPRYAMSFIAAGFIAATRRKQPALAESHRVSILLAGYNEGAAIERCVRSFHEQSRPPDEIILVSDGSEDDMPQKARELHRAGLVDQVHCTQLRCGKSAAINLCERWATGDIVVIADCDCTYDRHAIEQILVPFSDPAVGGVCGNLLVRNCSASLIAKFQAIEYLVSISLGKQASAILDQVVTVSGAFGAFRREAFASAGSYNVGGGEDLDLTLSLRKRKWKVAFAPDSICYTDTPASVSGLVRQRFRWERDAIRLRYRKHGDLMRPFATKFQPKELFHEIEFLILNVTSAVLLPVYVIWLFMTYGEFALSILISIHIGLFVLDGLTFLIAALVTPKADSLALLPYLPGYSVYNGMAMRLLQLSAYMQEWLFNASAQDNYVPEKVRLVRKW
jgi:cellulose synthase/poly-beta-1,6-N-acetylglucosamine synthase-like glycosyltransferase